MCFSSLSVPGYEIIPASSAQKDARARRVPRRADGAGEQEETVMDGNSDYRHTATLDIEEAGRTSGIIVGIAALSAAVACLVSSFK